jgi:hypothetical protein
MDKSRQLLRNPDFLNGLHHWLGEGDGVARVESAGEHVVHLHGTASLTSEPVEVVAGATYAVAVRTETQGPSEVSADIVWISGGRGEISRDSVAADDGGPIEHTAPPEAAFVSIKVSCHEGEVFVRSAAVTPVGPRIEVTALESAHPVLLNGVPGALLCEISNTGSEPVTNGHVELRTGREIIAAPAEPTHSLPPLPPGESQTVIWPILAPDPGVYGVQVRVRGAGQILEHAGAVVVGEEPVRLASDGSGLSARRSHVTMSTRTFRIILPHLEYGFGTGQFDFGDPMRFGGWIRCLGTALGEPGEVPRLLYGRRSRVTGTTLVLYNSDALADWEFTLRPSPHRQAITVATQYVSRKAHTLAGLEGVSLCFEPLAEDLEPVLSRHSVASVARRGDRCYAAQVSWREAETGALSITAADPGRGSQACAVLTLRQPQMVPGRRIFWQQEVWVGAAEDALTEG